jgi:hypothetical protein
MLRCSARIDQRDGTVDRAHAVCDEQRFRLRQRTAADEHHTVQKAQKRAEQNTHEQGVDLSDRSMRDTVTTATSEMRPATERSMNPPMMTNVMPSETKLRGPKLAHDVGHVLTREELRLYDDRDDNEQHNRDENQIVHQNFFKSNRFVISFPPVIQSRCP